MIFTTCDDCDRLLVMTNESRGVANTLNPQASAYVHYSDDGAAVPEVDARDHDAVPREPVLEFGSVTAALRELR